MYHFGMGDLWYKMKELGDAILLRIAKELGIKNREIRNWEHKSAMIKKRAWYCKNSHFICDRKIIMD